MTPDQYYAVIHKMRLTRKVGQVFVTEDGDTQRVPNPSSFTSDQMIETLLMICRTRMLDPADYGLDQAALKEGRA